MKFLAALFVLGLVAVLAASQPSVEKFDESSDELVDEFIGSSESPSSVRNLREVLQQLGNHVNVDIERFTDHAETLLKKGSKVTGSIFDYLKNVSENGKEKIVQLFYRGTEDGSSDQKSFFIPDIFRKLRDYLEKSDNFEKFKGLVERFFTKSSSLGKQFLEILRTKGKYALIEISNRMLGRAEENSAVDSSRSTTR